MPRAGGTYTLPFPDTVPNTTIESVKYNSTNHDIEFDLNQPRPISAGGTGGTSGDSALASLNAEKSTQIVADYNTMAFLPGSFASTATALNGPVNGHNFAGICYSSDPLPTAPNFVVTNNNLVLEARDLDDGIVGPPLTVSGTLYIRQKKAGVWGLWAKSGGVGTAPFDALAYNGMQVNGAFDISQEIGLGGLQTTIGGYACDGWLVFRAGSSVTSAGAVGATGSDIQPAAGLQNMLLHQVQTAQVSMGTSDSSTIQHPVEGYRTARLNWGTAQAKPLTICFWSAHHRPGLYSVSIRNAASNRTYVATYTQAVADVSQFNTITVPGDTAGTWAKDNTVGVNVTLTQAAGATLTAPAANTWYGVNYLAAPGQVNAVADTLDKFRIAGFLMLPGTDAPPSDRVAYIMRPADQEILTCMRYWEKGTQEMIYMNIPSGVTTAYGTLRFAAVKRAAPTVTPTNFQYWLGGSPTVFTPSITFTDLSKFFFQGSGLSNWNGWFGGGTWTASARLI